MGLLSTIASLAPTVGTIIGSLLGGQRSANGEMGVISYDFSGLLSADRVNENKPFKVSFAKEGEEFLMVNQSLNAADTVTLSTPAMGDMEASTITVPGLRDNILPLNEVFNYNAEFDNSTLQLTASPGGSFVQSLDALAASDAPMSMTASARNVMVNGAEEKRISPYLYAKVKNNVIELRTQGVNLSGVRSLNIQGSGDSAVTVTNIDLESPQSKVTIPLPHGLIDNDMVNLDVSAEISSLKTVLAMQKNAGVKLRTASNDLLAKLDSAVVLNKR